MKRLTSDEVAVTLSLGGDVQDRLRAYVDLLGHWQRKINLVGPKTLDEAWTRHILDSAQLAPLITAAPDGPWVDLGSGAGFPGLVGAIVTGRPVTLVEADVRKAAFLTRVVGETGAPAEVAVSRIEALAPVGAMLVTARALAPLEKLFGYAHRHLAPGGQAVFLKGRNLDGELTQAQKNWIFTSEIFSSRSDPDGVILKVEGLTLGLEPPAN
ncbi:MAG: 16S rRNA (guanine(527)-N(7))-methyltransferase RsmG [Rhodospirillales bacterium]